MHYVYLLKSERYPKQQYIGLTSDLRKRLLEHNNAKSRLNQLLEQIPALVAEAIPLVNARNELHRRLGQELHHMPYDEWPKLPAGEPLTAPDVNATPNMMIEVPRGAIADAIEAGLAQARVAAAERQRAAAHGEA